MIDDESESGGRIGAGDGGPDGPGHPETVVRRTVRPGESIDEAVIDSVSVLCESDPDLTSALGMEPMYETVDVDALAALYTGEGSDSVSVEFCHAGYRFTVTDDEIVVEGVGDAGTDDEPPGR